MQPGQRCIDSNIYTSGYNAYIDSYITIVVKGATIRRIYTALGIKYHPKVAITQQTRKVMKMANGNGKTVKVDGVGNPIPFAAIAKAYWSEMPVYKSTDGTYQVPLGDLPVITIFNGLTPKFDHVFGNEAISPASSERKKNPSISEEAYRKIVLDQRVKLHDRMKDGTWGFKEKTQGPKIPSADDKTRLFNKFLVIDTMVQIGLAVKAGHLVIGKAAHTWVDPETKAEQGIEYWGKNYLASTAKSPDPNFKTLGDARKASVQARADAEFTAREQAAKMAKVNAAESVPASGNGKPKFAGL